MASELPTCPSVTPFTSGEIRVSKAQDVALLVNGRSSVIRNYKNSVTHGPVDRPRH